MRAPKKVVQIGKSSTIAILFFISWASTLFFNHILLQPLPLLIKAVWFGNAILFLTLVVYFSVGDLLS